MSFKSFFFISSPLQYINCLNLAASVNGEKKLYCSTEFVGALGLYNKIIDHDQSWNKVKIFKQRKIAYLNLLLSIKKGDRVYLDSDYAFDGLLVALMSIKGAIVNIYEEGVFTYREDLFSLYNKNKVDILKVKIFRLLNLNNKLVNTSVNSVYVYRAQEFKLARPDVEATKVRALPFSFYRGYIQNKKILDAVFDLSSLEYSSSGFDVIYCGPKNLSEIKELSEISLSNKVLFKNHPAANFSRDQVSNALNIPIKNIEVIDLAFPLEIYVYSLKDISGITLYHHNSSIASNLKDLTLSIHNVGD